MKLQLHPEAEEELFQGAAWYDDQELGLGAELLEEVSRWFEVIVESPNTWPRWPRSPDFTPWVRRVVVERFPYALAYQVFDDRVWVVAVVHTSKEPMYWLGRL